MLFFPLLAILRVAAYEVSMSSRDKMAYPQPATYARNGLFAALTGSSGGASALGGHAQSTNGAAGSFFATYPSACGAVGASPSDAVDAAAGRAVGATTVGYQSSTAQPCTAALLLGRKWTMRAEGGCAYAGGGGRRLGEGSG